MRRAALLVVLAALVTACGGEETTSPKPETVEGGTTATTTQPQPQQPQPASGDAAAGKQAFASNGCGSCHTFKPAGSSGTTGPDLDKLPDFAQKAGKPLPAFVHESIVDPNAYVEQGFPEGVMPSYDKLSDKQVDDLVAFLTQA